MKDFNPWVEHRIVGADGVEARNAMREERPTEANPNIILFDSLIVSTLVTFDLPASIELENLVICGLTQQSYSLMFDVSHVTS